MFDINKLSGHNSGMKKAFLFFVVLSALIVAGCGVKSELVSPDSSFPRNYPVY